MDEEMKDVQSIELPFKASVDYEDRDAYGPGIGQFVGSGILHCPVCGNRELELRLVVVDKDVGAKLDFYCSAGYGHSSTLEVNEGLPGEVIWVLTATDDALDMREALKHAGDKFAGGGGAGVLRDPGP